MARPERTLPERMIKDGAVVAACYQLPEEGATDAEAGGALPRQSDEKCQNLTN